MLLDIHGICLDSRGNWGKPVSREAKPGLGLPAFDGEGQLQDDQVDLDAEAQVDLAQAFADSFQSSGCTAFETNGFFANVFHR